MRPGRPRYHNKAAFVSWIDAGRRECTMFALGKKKRDVEPLVVDMSELPEEKEKERVLVATVPEHTSLTKGDEVSFENWDMLADSVSFFDFFDQ